MIIIFSKCCQYPFSHGLDTVTKVLGWNRKLAIQRVKSSRNHSHFHLYRDCGSHCDFTYFFYLSHQCWVRQSRIIVSILQLYLREVNIFLWGHTVDWQWNWSRKDIFCPEPCDFPPSPNNRETNRMAFSFYYCSVSSTMEVRNFLINFLT